MALGYEERLCGCPLKISTSTLDRFRLAGENRPVGGLLIPGVETESPFLKPSSVGKTTASPPYFLGLSLCLWEFYNKAMVIVVLTGRSRNPLLATDLKWTRKTCRTGHSTHHLYKAIYKSLCLILCYKKVKPLYILFYWDFISSSPNNMLILKMRR